MTRAPVLNDGNVRVDVEVVEEKLTVPLFVRHAIALIVVVALREIDAVVVPAAPVSKHVTGAVPGTAWHAATVDVVE